jgi:hypothetical protein
VDGLTDFPAAGAHAGRDLWGRQTVRILPVAVRRRSVTSELPENSDVFLAFILPDFRFKLAVVREPN